MTQFCQMSPRGQRETYEFRKARLGQACTALNRELIIS